jgi:hypothetical protein
LRFSEASSTTLKLPKGVQYYDGEKWVSSLAREEKSFSNEQTKNILITNIPGKATSTDLLIYFKTDHNSKNGPFYSEESHYFIFRNMKDRDNWYTTLFIDG